jgi:hypothetical protein
MKPTVKRILIPMPPDDQLPACLEKLEIKLSSIVRVGAQAVNAPSLLGQLGQVALTKAFRGELALAD